MARDSEKKEKTDGHDPSLRTPTQLAGSPIARDLENKRMTRVMSSQRVGKVSGSSRSDTQNKKKGRKRMIRVVALQRNRKSLL